MYSHTPTQKFLVLLPQEQPAAQLQLVNPPSPTSSQNPANDTEFSTTLPQYKTERSSSTSSTSSTTVKSLPVGFLKLGP
ncbi:hypothetical protein FQN55_005227 [Onygenales sp. PD_40]|nr:hypothetical protein FQN55_005227 [Onygenales sp. PD_40]